MDVGSADIAGAYICRPCTLGYRIQALLSGITQLSNRSVIQEVDYCIRRRDLNYCSLHGGIHDVSQTGDPDTCRLVKHRRYKNSTNEKLLYFKSQFEFVFINT